MPNGNCYDSACSPPKIRVLLAGKKALTKEEDGL
jgi:hypothetical protein